MIALAAMSIADAPSHKPIAWQTIDWAAVQRTVRRLQVRIVKAAQAGEWHKVRSLQRLLANSFEELLHKQFPANHQKVHLVRYADDFIVTAAERPTLEEGVLPLVQKFLAERGLRLSPTKTTITHIDDGFDFLGQTLCKYNGKFLITPSEKNPRRSRRLSWRRCRRLSRPKAVVSLPSD